MTTEQQELQRLFSKTPFSISYHFDMADLLIMAEDEKPQEHDIYDSLHKRLTEKNSTIHIQTYKKSLYCHLDDEIFELYPLERIPYQEWQNLLNLCATQYKCIVNDLKAYKGGIIDTYEGISFKIQSCEVLSNVKAIVPFEDTFTILSKDEAEKYKQNFTIIEERGDYLYVEYQKEKYEVKSLLGYFEIYKEGKYIDKCISKDEVYKFISTKY